MGKSFYFLWEAHLIERLQEILYQNFWVAIFSFISEFGEELVLIAIMGFLYWGYDKGLGRFVGLNTVSVLVWNPFIKNIFVRRRPYFDISSIKALKPVDAKADLFDISAQGFSFPSGHSSGSAGTFWSLYVKLEKPVYKFICFIIPILVGISRFVLGVHYPTDVLGGWALGIAVILVVPFLQRVIKNQYIFFGLMLALAFPGFFFCDSKDFYTGYGIMAGVILSLIFDEKVVKFENTKRLWECLLRTLGGVVIYLLLNTLLKMPFSKEFLDSGVKAAYIVRTVRYMIVVFVTVGVYPILFKYMSRIGQKKHSEN